MTGEMRFHIKNEGKLYLNLFLILNINGPHKRDQLGKWNIGSNVFFFSFNQSEKGFVYVKYLATYK